MVCKKLIAWRIDPATEEKLNKVASAMERSKSWIINKGVVTYLDELEDLLIAQERFNDPNAQYVNFDDLKKERIKG